MLGSVLRFRSHHLHSRKTVVELLEETRSKDGSCGERASGREFLKYPPLRSGVFRTSDYPGKAGAQAFRRMKSHGFCAGGYVHLRNRLAESGAGGLSVSWRMLSSVREAEAAGAVLSGSGQDAWKGKNDVRFCFHAKRSK